MNLPVQASELFAEFSRGGPLVARYGPDATVRGFAAREHCGPGDLVFVDRYENLEAVLARRPAAVVLGQPDDADGAVDFERLGTRATIFVASNLSLAHAKIRGKYHARDPRDSEWGPGAHPSAVVHESAALERDVLVGPRAVIGAGVRIGRGSVVMAGVVIERGARIGENVVIHPNAVIGYDCELGDRVVVKSGAVIGSEGFGFAQDEARRSYRIPQTGRVVVEADVEIGAGNCIDRATYGETRLGRGTKLDNLCHVAHNVQVGEDCLLTAGFVVAGSTSIGNRVIASGQSGVLDHLRVADDVILVHRAGVLEDIDQAGIYAGIPAQPLAGYMKNTAILRNLNDLRKRIGALEKSLRKD